MWVLKLFTQLQQLKRKVSVRKEKTINTPSFIANLRMRVDQVHWRLVLNANAGAEGKNDETITYICVEVERSKGGGSLI